MQVSSSRQRSSLAFQRLAACLAKVVQCTRLKLGKKWA